MDPPSVLRPTFSVEGLNLTEECKNLLLSLPREKWFVVSDLYQYQGFWHSPKQLQSILSCQNHFEVQNSDVLLVTIPKSGTTWLKAMAFAIVNRARYPYPDPDHPLVTTNPHNLVPFLDTNFTAVAELVQPRLFASHLSHLTLPQCFMSSGCKIVYLCRNPKDTFISFWHFINKMRSNTMGTGPVSLEEFFEKFCKGAAYGGPFWDHVLGYWKKSLEMPEKILFLTYEDMMRGPRAHVTRLAEFLGYPFSPEEVKHGVIEEVLTLCSFDTLRNLEVNKVGKTIVGIDSNAFFRQGEVGDSENYLTPDMINMIDQITNQKFHGSGLIF